MLITYFVPQGTRDLASISLQAYNVKGARVAMLLDRTEKAGTYTVLWPARGVSPGTYVLRLKVDGQNELMRKVVKE